MLPDFPTRLVTLAIAATMPALAAAQSAAPARPDETTRSTAQIDVVLEPAPLPAPTRVELPADRLSTVHEGRTSATDPAHRVVDVPPGRMIEIRVASPESAASISVFRGPTAEPEAGTTRANGSVGWISTTADGGELRIVIWTDGDEEIPFRLLVKVHAAPDEPEPPAAGATGEPAEAPAASSAEE